MPINTAAWLTAKQANLEIKPAPYTHPREDEIVVKNHAVAINPIDWLIQVKGMTFRVVLRLVWSNVSLQVKCRTRHIRTKSIYGSTLKGNEVSKVIYEDFLPKALAEGRYVAAPAPDVVGKGLKCVQIGFDAQRKGVSAKKAVVSL